MVRKGLLLESLMLVLLHATTTAGESLNMVFKMSS